MARIRTIKPDSAVSLSTQGVSIEARYFFQNLWCHLDDEGRVEWLPKMILAMIFPSEDDPYTVADLNRWLAELESKDGMLRAYTVDGTKYVEAPKFKDHQVISRPSKSRCPAPPDDSRSTHGGLSEDSVNCAKNGEKCLSPEVFEPKNPDSMSTHGGLSEDSLRARKEQGKEQGKGREGKAHSRTPPTKQDCETAAQCLGMPKSEGAKFFDHYESVGWKNGSGLSIENWQAALSKWKTKWQGERQPGYEGRRRPGKLEEPA